MQYDRTPRTGELTCFLAHRGPQLDLRPVGSFARPPPAPRRHSKQPDEEQEDDELCVVIYDLEDGEVGAEDEVEMAEAGGGEVEETKGIREIVVQNLSIPEPMRGPRKRRRPPREEWIVNQDLYRQQGAGGAQADAEPFGPHHLFTLASPRLAGRVTFSGSIEVVNRYDVTPSLSRSILSLHWRHLQN